MKAKIKGICLMLCICCACLSARSERICFTVPANLEDLRLAWQKMGEVNFTAKLYDWRVPLAEHLRGTAPPDLFTLQTHNDDYSALIETGLLMDLSENEQIRSNMLALRPIFQTLFAEKDGCIYGVPQRVTATNCLYWLPQNWKKLGINATQSPDSAETLFDFLEAWLASPLPGSCILSAGEVAQESFGITGCLVIWLVNTWNAQCQFAKTETKFNCPALIEAVQRAYTIGRRLDSLPITADALPLFCARNMRGITQAGAPVTLHQLVPCRIKADQPPLLLFNADLICVRTDCAHPMEAMALAAQGMRVQPAWAQAILYTESVDLPFEETQTTWEWLASLSTCGLTAFLPTAMRWGNDCNELYESLIQRMINSTEFAIKLDYLYQTPLKERNL